MDWIISDTHGCFYALQSLIAQIKQYDDKFKLIFVGDYVDRGKNNKMMVDYCISLQKEGHEFLLGNHDNIINWMVNKDCKGDLSNFVYGAVSPVSITKWWMVNGLYETLVDYGVKDVNRYCDSKEAERMYDEFNALMPQNHKEFFAGLNLYWESDTHFACHAYFNPDKELPRSMKFVSSDVDNETLWSRFSPYSLTVPTKWDKIGVFGHTPVQNYGSVTPIKWDKIRLIDTGSFIKNGYICAYSCQNDDWILQSTDSRDVVQK